MLAIRWIAGTPVAAMITLGLFLMMAALIATDDLNLRPAKPAPDLAITAKLEPTTPKRATPTKPQIKTPPETIIERVASGKKPTFKGAVPNPDVGVTDPLEITGPVGAPLIRIAPAYPERCRSRGATGTVLVQFDVAADGSVVNPVILQSADGCFDRTVIKAVSGWKYPPAYRGGQPVTRYGVTETFNFQLAE